MKEHLYLVGITAAGVFVALVAYNLADHFVLTPYVTGAKHVTTEAPKA